MESCASKIRVMVACGGTGGHIFPGLAIAEILQARGCDVTLLLAGRDVESTALKDWQGAVLTVPARGIRRRSLGAVCSALWHMCLAFYQWQKIFRSATPAVLVAMGGYGSAGPVGAAKFLKIPIILHEANAVPGRAVRWLARWASVIAVHFPETCAHLKHPQLALIGMPITQRSASVPEPAFDALRPDHFTLLVMGGSAGARRLNELAPLALARVIAQGHQVQVIHLTGTADASLTRQAYTKMNIPHVVSPFLHNMPQAYQRAQLALCRAGAATCAELAFYAVPALFVPYPHATNNHQMANALACARDGAADVLAEPALNAESLADYLIKFITSPARAERMRAAMRARAVPDAAERMAELVLTHAKSN